MRTLNRGDRVTVDGYRGIAFWVLGPTTSTDEDGDEYDTGEIDVRMVGDDRTFVVDPDDCTPIDDEEFCPDCGQVGCGWGH